MSIKKYIYPLFVFILSAIYAQAQEYEQSGIFCNLDYYGLPLRANVGYLYRINDFSLFPYIGMGFDVDEDYELSAFTGFDMTKEWFSWKNEFSYELLPALATSSPVFFKGTSAFEFKIPSGNLAVPISAGNKRFKDMNSSVKTEFFVSAALAMDFFLIDTGILRATMNTKLEATNIPKSNFSFYEIALGLPLSFTLFLCTDHLRKAILWNSAFKWIYFFLCFSLLFFSQLFVRLP